MRKVPPDLRRSAPVVREAVGTLLQALVCQQIAHTPNSLQMMFLQKRLFTMLIARPPIRSHLIIAETI